MVDCSNGFIVLTTLYLHSNTFMAIVFRANAILSLFGHVLQEDIVFLALSTIVLDDSVCAWLACCVNPESNPTSCSGDRKQIIITSLL